MLDSGASNSDFLSDVQSNAFDSSAAATDVVGNDDDDEDVRSKVSVIRKAAFNAAKAEKIAATEYAIRSPYSVSLPPSNDPNKNPDEINAACLPRTAPI
mmetsp:Transcript_17601/g.29735  ORF Transcript_17601/g.29735 Transcript_17601/m.29735 type:complete len:99 (-) Transcript_17601:760-1056(-)